MTDDSDSENRYARAFRNSGHQSRLAWAKEVVAAEQAARGWPGKKTAVQASMQQAAQGVRPAPERMVADAQAGLAHMLRQLTQWLPAAEVMALRTELGNTDLRRS